MQDKQLIIIGASARAAADSAYYSGYLPYWIDQFGDEDLRSKFSGEVVAPEEYPAGIIPLLEQAPVAPVLYTGAMENHLAVLEKLEERLLLLGNPGDVCRQLQDHKQLAHVIKQAGYFAPQVIASGEPAPVDGQWLQKPVQGAGGLGISYLNIDSWTGKHYLQEVITGESQSAVFVANGDQCVLLAVSRQLVGENAFHADQWSYCGSIGPLQLSDEERQQWQGIGSLLTRTYTLRGLFGVDAINRNGEIWPVEINPRYTASVEVLEMSTGLQSIQLHVQACTEQKLEERDVQQTATAGKAYLFADKEVTIPAVENLLALQTANEMVRLADLPATGSVISCGHPILTVLVRGMDSADCDSLLRESAAKIFTILR